MKKKMTILIRLSLLVNCQSLDIEIECPYYPIVSPVAGLIATILMTSPPSIFQVFGPIHY